MTLQARPRAGQRRALTFLLQFATVLLPIYAGLPDLAAAKAQGGISIELNKAHTVAGACMGTFVLRNGFGQALDRFQLDLFVFDADGVIKLRSNIDLAPLRSDKSTVIAFRLLHEPCAAVSRILVNDIPLCRTVDGSKHDCLNGLTVSSRDRIELAK